MSNDPIVDRIMPLEFNDEALLRREHTVRKLVVLLTALGSLIIFTGMAVFTIIAIQQRQIAESQAQIATKARERAEVQAGAALRERDIALSLDARLKQSTPVLTVSPDSRRSVSAAGWLLDEDGKPISQIATNGMTFATFSPNSYFVLINSASTLSLFEADDGKLVVRLPDLGGMFFAVFSPDSRSLLIGSERGVFRCALPECPVTPTLAVGSNVPIIYAAFAPDSPLLVLGTANGDILVSRDGGSRFVQLEPGAPGSPEHGGVRATAFSRGGQAFIILYKDGQGDMIDLTTGKVIAHLQGFLDWGTTR